ncbi:dynein light intermediate chain-domain-containing protein [Thelephora terrestris]|uniref:Dynein light intermediate chain-domain-containing protein n=1 Tax=Thelephora terrestris TaxID=56493 RepID=A0A9P6H928_9AGAM|nr:dynein light intermediate chain-domain-containing protein [Thelephora terrestris]
MSRSSTPESPPQDLWSSILDSVSRSRSIPAKQVLILGQPSSGKSTIASALLQKPPSDDPSETNLPDFALGYDWADVRDEGDEDILARLSVYTVPSSATTYTSLLPDFLPPRQSLPHTVVIIALDWTRPWTFIEELQMWLVWVEQWAKGDGSRELEIAREEQRERLQSHLQHYAEPSSEPLPTTTHSSTLLPLGPGTFTHNTGGVSIIVTCTKADLIDDNSDIVGTGAAGMGGMVKGKGGEWEERTDSIMQVLRTICLKYGAGLFYTTQQPTTLQVLRRYVLHLLFTPAPSPAVSTNSEAGAPPRNPFPFQHRTNTLDRDRIVVPAGWDSWGKIAVLREGFDAKSWGEAWERDVDMDASDTAGTQGAKAFYSSLVSDQGTKPPALPPFNNPTPEQIFLAKHYDEKAKRTDPQDDPRRAFNNPLENATAGVVGPMSASSLHAPNVDRALAEMENSQSMNLSASVNGPDVSRKLSRSTRAVSSLATGTASGRSTASSPPISSPSPTGHTQHEVLQHFFQSLLSSKDRSGAANAAKTTMSPPPPAANESGTNGDMVS